jgi:F-type H+-transporting ATPase subunit b
MPQLDLSTYISQIFWFLICFVSLYLSAHFVILPRITNLIKSRSKIIDSDLSSANKLDHEISKLQNKNEKLRAEANKKYQEIIEEVVKAASKNREKSVEELKNKVEMMNKKSRLEIRSFVEKSQNDISIQAANLGQLIKEKILN